MKKITFLLVAFGLALSVYSFMPALPPNCNHNLAEAAARSNQNFHQCVQAAHDPHFQIDYYVVSTDGPDGCTYSVQAIKTFRCTQEPCPKIAAQIVATASVDVNYNVTAVTCNQ